MKVHSYTLTKKRILHEWSFHLKFMKRAFGEFRRFQIMTTSVRFCLIASVEAKKGFQIPDFHFHNISMDTFMLIWQT